MWPSITAFRSFSNIACPSGASCALPHCIFSHDAAKSPDRRRSQSPATAAYDPEPVAKRLKLDDSAKRPAEQAAPAAREADPKALLGSNMSKGKAPSTNQETGTASATFSKPPAETKPSTASLRAATRPVSPPPTAATAKAIVNPDTPVSLVPKKLNKDPATFTKRVALLKALHSYMKVQNDRLLKAIKPEIKALHLNSNQLNKLAVDEEERIALSNPSVYENILKQRLVKLKSFTPEDWVKERRAAIAMQNGESSKKPPPKRVDTGLNSDDEITFLRTLKCDQSKLDAFGYVTKLPEPSELNETSLALEAAAGWEECDRWSEGCSTNDTHVYNVKNPKRLSLIMPFIETPENDKVPVSSAVAFDCEMGYTTNGLEMLRLTVISWPQHKPLVDVLVRPLGQILDFNTRFSGITREQFVNAKPYDPANPKPVRKDLRIVESPYEARNLFLSYVSPSTPVVGHALENDLNTIRLIHPLIVDTVLLYPTRQGLPFRFGLRKLASDHLQEDIQQAGAAGHDSYEDARTTGELVRLKVKEQWKKKKSDGFEIRDGGVHPPMPPGGPPAPALNATPVPTADMGSAGKKPVAKRKLEDGGEGVAEEPPAKKVDMEGS
ncbi:rna exonuclease 3 [Stemphylium lycopersici]|uniref:Rna exonuclease 3 n=1 Tax=Stemphylium lycopersici TaxID=183478 RepID=A0A364NDH4_STELY|nr:rna exonuclease 3 [Stemphylium lycopersici]RAR00962.1 rna exonuclease 3 [Stemphylium lycopersici]RAR15257.1 rna exonuclease 3 [Stemphylium lycopersici]